jgi:hypothetical protein
MPIDRAVRLMEEFAARTGVVGGTDRRYLWTDSFAVCNFVGLARATGQQRYLQLARQLVDHVHRVLGRHRSDDGRTGWISGLSEAEGEIHPTIGGLRIGKPLPERRRDEPFDERLEWERDGQYFHYLTKWMYALRQLHLATSEPRFATWARELAASAFRTFVAGSRMYWKMSIDLTRPLVSSMGQHDPLDGHITCRELQTLGVPGPDLEEATARYRELIDRRSLATADPLGLGGLLVDGYRVMRSRHDRTLAIAVFDAAATGLSVFATQPAVSIRHRLGFRELGLAIGLRTIERLDDPLAERFAAHLPLAGDLAELWWHQRPTRSWRDHEDINDVMLATCLAPDGLLA